MRSKHPEVRWWRNENTRDHGQIMISGHNFAENINWKRKARRYTGMEHSPQLKCKEWKRECIKHLITLCISLFLQFSKFSLLLFEHVYYCNVYSYHKETTVVAKQQSNIPHSSQNSRVDEGSHCIHSQHALLHSCWRYIRSGRWRQKFIRSETISLQLRVSNCNKVESSRHQLSFFK